VGSAARAGYTPKVIHLFHPHDGLKIALDVFIDDIKVAHLDRGASINVSGSGKPQELIVRATGAGESPALMVTDPGPNGWIGVEVSYQRFRGIFKPKSSLLAEIMTITPPP
jgi:hypothetical protein